MKLIKYDNFWNDPFADFENTMRQIFGDRFNKPSFFWNELPAELHSGFRVDTYSSDDGYKVVAELPGIPKEAIEVNLENALLTISGEHKEGDGDDERTIRFNRTITVGDGIDANKVEATLRDGLLTIALPKIEERKPRAITVN